MRFRAIVALSAVAVAALFAPAAANAAALYPPTVCATISVSTTNPLPGESIVVSGVDFLANASVQLELQPPGSVLKTVTTDSSGSFSTSVKLPDGVTGRLRVVATSGAPHTAGCPNNPFVVLNIQKHGTEGSSASTGGHHGTSFTGVDVLLVLLAAALLIAAGAALTMGGKRKHAN